MTLSEISQGARRRAVDGRAAADIATAAGALLLAHRTDQERAYTDPSDIRRAGDQLSHDFLVTTLGERFPGDPVLSEEGADDRARLMADRVWIVDPLDGTREFGEPGRTDWAVHVALVEGGDRSPVRSRCLHRVSPTRPRTRPRRSPRCPPSPAWSSAAPAGPSR